MPDPAPFRRPQPERLTRRQFETEVRALVEAGNYKIKRHLARDHPERNITPTQIEKCLMKGFSQIDPYLDPYGNWKSELCKNLAGSHLTVVAVIEWETRVVVITAF